VGCLPIAAPAATGPFEDHQQGERTPVRTTRTRSVTIGVVWAITFSGGLPREDLGLSEQSSVVGSMGLGP
jgi:hypothetical protein